MSGLRVLLVGPYPLQPGRVVGGIEAVTSALAPALAEQEDVAQITVLCFHHGQIVSHCKKVSDRLRIWYLRGQDRLALPTRSFLEVLRARRAAAEIEPDVVHGQGIGVPGDIATRISRASVVTAHGIMQVEARLREKHPIIGPTRIWLVDRMARRVLGRAKVVISTSDYNRRMLDELVRNHHVGVSNPVCLSFFDCQTEPDSKRILFAGIMIPLKNVLGIVRAFALVKAQVSDARLDLVGPLSDANYAAKVRQLVSELDLETEVVFRGFVENSQLLDLMGRCSVLVLFSIQEASPTVIAQAMAMGKPVVASRVGGIPEMVRDGDSGFVVNVGDEQALADRLVTLLKSPGLCRIMGARGHEIARQRFEPSAVARQTLEAYRLARSIGHE